MKRLSNRGFAAVTLLSIILPVGLLVSFRMSGIIPEPQRNLEVKIIHDEYFKVVGVNQPKNASLSILCWWAFFDEDSSDHWVTVTLETVYLNRTSYQKVIIPISLGVLVP